MNAKEELITTINDLLKTLDELGISFDYFADCYFRKNTRFAPDLGDIGNMEYAQRNVHYITWRAKSGIRK